VSLGANERVRRTISVRAALAASQPQQAGLTACAQRYSHGRHLVIGCTESSCTLAIDGFAFPPMPLEAIERILSTGNLRIPLHEGWVTQFTTCS
jgi:hypothetical protein